jgi:hypothetical protein
MSTGFEGPDKGSIVTPERFDAFSAAKEPWKRQ